MKFQVMHRVSVLESHVLNLEMMLENQRKLEEEKDMSWTSYADSCDTVEKDVRIYIVLDLELCVRASTY
jgi:hypothetical protein